jgi:prepilin-type N-terminal cleavage/methylation domain-containing protein
MILGKRNRGFTLIELMIVIAIIGILAAIAIPQFAAYRTRGFNSTSLSDLRNMVTAQEAYFADKQSYSATTAELTLYGYTPSNNATGSVVGSNATSYSLTASHSSGDRTWRIIGPGGIIQ